jgi:hypothetical protein
MTSHCLQFYWSQICAQISAHRIQHEMVVMTPMHKPQLHFRPVYSECMFNFRIAGSLVAVKVGNSSIQDRKIWDFVCCIKEWRELYKERTAVFKTLVPIYKKHGVNTQKNNQQLCFFNKLAWFLPGFRTDLILSCIYCLSLPATCPQLADCYHNVKGPFTSHVTSQENRMFIVEVKGRFSAYSFAI